MKIRSFIASVLGLCLLICLASSIALGQNSSGKDKTHIIIGLKATGVEPNATGIADVKSKMDKDGMLVQSFKLTGADLTAGQTYTLFANGQMIDSKEAKTDNGGAVAFSFSQRPPRMNSRRKPKEFPTPLNPVTAIKHVELHDSNNQVVLTGDFSQ
jgi:hypothetical protein